MSPKLRVAACHVSPIFLNAKATTDKCISLIHRASRASANLVVFPESYIPAFPIWSALFAPTENHAFFQRMVENSVSIDSEEIELIRAAAKDTNMIVSIGISEKANHSSATLYNSNLIIGANGEVLVHHRKLMPTFFEKLTWSPGDGYGLRVADTPFGKIGALICGENTNPLARYALMAMGEQVHISNWPAVWPTRRAIDQTASQDGAGKQSASYDNVNANRTRAAAHCFEAKCFGVLCAGHLDQAAIDEIVAFSGDPSCRETLQRASRAPSMFLNPNGAPHPSFTVDDETGAVTEKVMLQDEVDILYADFDLSDCIEGKQYHDVAGGYQRLDVFQLHIDKSRKPPASVTHS